MLRAFSLVLLPAASAFVVPRCSRMAVRPLSVRQGVTAADVLKAPQWPEAWPYTPADFRRQDESPDDNFYDTPRLVYHIDEPCVAALTAHYKEVFASFESPPDVLDICSSWVSHYPADAKLGNVCGVGMVTAELKENKRLSSFVAKDLNADPTLPYEEASFDVVTCVVSIDYMTNPRSVMEEVCRVLKPGGRAIMSISNRCFPTKAVAIWLQTNDLEHVFVVGSFFHYAGGFEPPFALDKSPNPGRSDPLYIIEATKAKIF